MIALFLSLGIASQSVSTGVLAPFAGAEPNVAGMRAECLQRANSGAGFFPFCHDVIVTEFGDEDFRQFWWGDGPEAFLSSSQRALYEQLIEQVEALTIVEPTGCIRTSIETCLASLSKEHFVTSQAVEPKWTPGDTIDDKAVVYVSAHPIPVFGERESFREQLARQARISAVLGPDERVRELTIAGDVGDGSLDGMMGSMLPTLLRGSFGSCVKTVPDIVRVARDITSIPMDIVEEGVDGKYGRKVITVCGEHVRINRFQPGPRGGKAVDQGLVLRWEGRRRT